MWKVFNGGWAVLGTLDKLIDSFIDSFKNGVNFRWFLERLHLEFLTTWQFLLWMKEKNIYSKIILESIEFWEVAWLIKQGFPCFIGFLFSFHIWCLIIDHWCSINLHRFSLKCVTIKKSLIRKFIYWPFK